MKGFGGSGSRRVAATVIAVGALGAPAISQAAASSPPLAHAAALLRCGDYEHARSIVLAGIGHLECKTAHEAIRNGKFSHVHFSTPGWMCENQRGPGGDDYHYRCSKGSGRSAEFMSFTRHFR